MCPKSAAEEVPLFETLAEPDLPSLLESDSESRCVNEKLAVRGYYLSSSQSASQVPCSRAALFGSEFATVTVNLLRSSTYCLLQPPRCYFLPTSRYLSFTSAADLVALACSRKNYLRYSSGFVIKNGSVAVPKSGWLEPSTASSSFISDWVTAPNSNFIITIVANSVQRYAPRTVIEVRFLRMVFDSAPIPFIDSMVQLGTGCQPYRLGIGAGLDLLTTVFDSFINHY